MSEQAFPCGASMDSKGLTKRELFMCLVVSGIMARDSSTLDVNKIVKAALRITDESIKALSDSPSTVSE